MSRLPPWLLLAVLMVLMLLVVLVSLALINRARVP